MKIIAKTKEALFTNKAESMAEVVVAFMVLTIVMALFAQGMKYSNNAERYAIDRTRDSDSAMQKLLDTVIAGGSGGTSGNTVPQKLDGQDNMLKLTMYVITPDGGGDNCVYYVFDADLS